MIHHCSSLSFRARHPRATLLLPAACGFWTESPFDEPLPLEKLPDGRCHCILLRRAPFKPDDEIEQRAARELVRELDGLPLALEQAAAYILAMQVTYVAYTESYRVRKLELLEEARSRLRATIPATVATTWLMNFEQVEARSKASRRPGATQRDTRSQQNPLRVACRGGQRTRSCICARRPPSDPLSVQQRSWSRLRASR